LWNSVATQGKIFSSPEHPDQLWAPPSFLVSENHGCFCWGSSGWGVKLNTNLHLVPSIRMSVTALLTLHIHKCRINAGKKWWKQLRKNNNIFCRSQEKQKVLLVKGI